MAVKLSTNLGPLKLDHPLINASGTFDVFEAGRILDRDMFADYPFAAYVPKTVTLNPRTGNPPPRLYETAAGLLNSIGLANKGIEAFIADDLPRLEKLPVPLIVSVAGEHKEDYGRCAGMLEGRGEVAAIELNISCPNIELDGRALGSDPESTREAVSQARKATSKFLIAKLTPNVTDIVEIASAAADGGADCLSVINTIHGMALDPVTLKPALGHVTGGLSGPAIKPVALRAVYLITRDLDVPVIGMGGATTARDVMEFLACGAAAVAIGTANFQDPLLADSLKAELQNLMEQHGYTSVNGLIGVSHKD